MAIVDGKIRCSDCKQFKMLTEFIPYIVKRGCGQCKKCKHIKIRIWEKKNPEKVAAWRKAARLKNHDRCLKNQRNFYHKNKDKFAAYSLKKLYGISIEQYNELLSKQNNMCGCCGRENSGRANKKLFVDHCHKTGKIRGLLCSACNFALGALGDSIDGVLNAVIYLRNFNNDLVSKQGV